MYLQAGSLKKIVSTIKEKTSTGFLSEGLNSLILLVPGALTSLLIFVLSSNKLLPHQQTVTVFVLNLLQIQMLGITVAKYGVDQIILSKLNRNNRISIKQFYSKRVIPLSIIFSIGIAYLKGISYLLYFVLLLPMEVFSIVTAIELSISRKFTSSSFITILGYPFILILIWLVNIFQPLTEEKIFTLFFTGSIIKFMAAILLRNKGKKEDIAILSFLLPLQQVGNFVMFRLDQLLIASGLFGALFLNDLSVSKYLFLAKFPEVASGIIVALAPIVYKKLGDKEHFSITMLFKNKHLLFYAASIFVVQIIVYIIFLQSQQASAFLIYLPFILTTLLILPANLVTYVLLKHSDIIKINFLNIVSCIAGTLILCISLLLHNAAIFCYIIPIILLCYLLLFNKWCRK